MRRLLATCAGIGVVVFGSLSFSQLSVADEATATSGSKLETLLTAELERVEGTDIIMSRVVMPPNTELPWHWHPGEEFAYVLEGSSILKRDGKPDLTVTRGEAVKISLKQVHTAVTTDEGATILVFRVHEHGQPERVLVD
jgi:quercetin dioxygenase-like cupin family protein